MSAKISPLGDLLASNSKNCILVKNPPGSNSSQYVFFPGCQLSGTAPHLVFKTYADLRKHLPEVGILLFCCGTPAQWSNQPELFQGGVQKFRRIWMELGKPVMITACSTCYQMFKMNLPEIKQLSLWEVLEQMDIPPCIPTSRETVALHDSCTTRQEKQIHDSVRKLLLRLGYSVEELPHSRESTICCGNKGLLPYTHPEAADRIAKIRMKESQADYVTYCVTCQQTFLSKGKRTAYLLDLFYGKKITALNTEERFDPSKRNENRATLKKQLLEEVWGEK